MNYDKMMLKLQKELYSNKILQTNVQDQRIWQKELAQKFHIPEQELYQKLPMISTTVDIHKDISSDGRAIPLHSHNFWEILFCCQGDVKYIIKDRQYLFQSGNVMIIEPETAHQPLFPSEIQLPYERYVLRIQKNFLEKCAFIYPDVFSVTEKCRKNNNWMLAFSSYHVTQNVNHFFEQMEKEMISQQEHWQDAVNLQVPQLLLYLNRFYSNAKEMIGQTVDEQLLESLIQYIFSNYNLPVTLEEAVYS